MSAASGSPDRALVARFILAMSAEAVFLAGRTWLLHHFPEGIAQELAWSAWRLPFIAIYFLLSRGLVAPSGARRGMPRHPILVAALALSLLDVFNTPAWSLDYRLVLAVTAPIVGLREELFYRAIVQGFLERFVNPVAAIVMASAIFTAYHYGAQPMNVVSITGIAASGVVLGVIYQRTRNLWLVAALHAFIDVLYALVPAIAIAPIVLLMCNLLAAMWALVWWRVDIDAHPRPGA